MKALYLASVALGLASFTYGSMRAVAQDATSDAGVTKMIPGDVAPGRLIKRVEPVYPGAAEANQVDGDVVMQIGIATDGTVHVIKVIHGLPQLIGSAKHAVSQWQYEPYRLNGVATPITTTVTVHFQFSSDKTGAGTPLPQVQAETNVRQMVEKPTLPPPPEGVMRISGRVMDALLDKRVEPIYPADSIAVDARGVVVLLVTVRKTGEVGDAQVLSGPTRFQSAALDAVKRWKYRPYEVEGEAVDVQTTVKLEFAPPH